MEISKDTSQSLRRRKLNDAVDTGWATIQTVCDLPRLFELRTTMGIYEALSKVNEITGKDVPNSVPMGDAYDAPNGIPPGAVCAPTFYP